MSAGLIQRLFEEYYVEKSNYEEQKVSSHWQYYSGQFDVEIGDNAEIIALSGLGFGSMMEKSRMNRVLAWIGHVLYLVRLDKRFRILGLFPKALRVCRKMGASFSFDVFKQICSLELILRHLKDRQFSSALKIMIIGDGYGFLSSLVKALIPSAKIVLVDIGKTLLFQAIYCQRVNHEATHIHIDDMDSNGEADFIYCPAEKVNLYTDSLDLAINIASMQEMTMKIVEEYFSFLRCHMTGGLFYCCNRESKQLPDGEIVEFYKYPWKPDDVHLVDETCPWYRWYLSLAPSKKGPTLFGVRIPLINYFDGPIFHRLTILSKA